MLKYLFSQEEIRQRIPTYFTDWILEIGRNLSQKNWTWSIVTKPELELLMCLEEHIFIDNPFRDKLVAK